jgi:signal transduction histidine kinase/ActR/RegA family two-component response regulator
MTYREGEDMAGAPEEEAERLAALQRYRILDAPPEDAFDRITALAAQIFGVAQTQLNFIDADRQWTLSAYGAERGQVDRSISFCARTIASSAALVVPDASEDPRFSANPLVIGSSGIRFYAGVPLQTPSGTKIGALCLIDTQPRDISETQIAMLAALAAIAVDELELRLAGRELVRENAARRKAEAEALQANAAKNDFLSRMSHELRTPLNAILGFGQLLELDGLTPEQHESVTQILKGGRHLLGLIDEVLDIARVEAGRLGVSLEPVALWDVVQESKDLVRPLAAKRRLKLDIDLPRPAALYVLADRQRLTQVLVNLLSNAIKYNRAGGRVTLDASVTDAGRIRLTVTDTGLGIALDKLKRVFVPFDRLGAEQTNVEGTGLGLALSKQLVTLMNGTIGVQSAVGTGSTFWVELPRAESPLVGLNIEATAREDDTVRIASDSRTVLYIEDNQSNLRLVQRILAHRPETVLLAAQQGRLGLELARAHLPELILLDLHLPDILGTEVLAQLQADPVTQDIPVVVISADATPHQIDSLLAAGARAYLTKPLDVREFFATLDSILTPVDQP